MSQQTQGQPSNLVLMLQQEASSFLHLQLQVLQVRHPHCHPWLAGALAALQPPTAAAACHPCFLLVTGPLLPWRTSNSSSQQLKGLPTLMTTPLVLAGLLAAMQALLPHA